MESRRFPKRIVDFIALALAFIAVLISGIGWWWASAHPEQFASSSLWPMPDLFLIYWTLVSLAGLFAVYLILPRLAWYVVGGLIPIMVISAWSFGLFVFFAFLFMLLSALLVSARPGQNWLETLGIASLGVITSLVSVQGLIWIANQMVA